MHILVEYSKYIILVREFGYFTSRCSRLLQDATTCQLEFMIRSIAFRYAEKFKTNGISMDVIYLSRLSSELCQNTVNFCSSIHLLSEWLGANFRTGECQVPFVNRFPIQHAPELLHIFLLAPHSMVEKPAMLVNADTE